MNNKQVADQYWVYDNKTNRVVSVHDTYEGAVYFARDYTKRRGCWDDFVDIEYVEIYEEVVE